MSAYFWTILIATAFSLAANVCNKQYPSRNMKRSAPTRLFLRLMIMTLVFTAGLRYYVGTDFGAYYNGLEIYGGNLSKSVRELDEPALPILATIIGWFTDDGLYFVFACSFITINLILGTTVKHTDAFIFACFLFIFTGIWHGTFNGVRQYLAAAIVFSAHRLIMDRKFIKYMLVVFLAFCVHKSAVIMTIPYFILRNRISFKNVLLLMLGTFILSANYDTVFSFIGLLKEESMSISDQAYYSNSVSILRVMVACAPPVLCLFLYAQHKPDKEQTFYINSLIMNGAAMLATANSTYLARLGIYTSMYVPLALSELLSFKNKRMEFFVKAVIVVLYFVFWYIEVSGSGNLNSFKWIWERKG